MDKDLDRLLDYIRANRDNPVVKAFAIMLVREGDVAAEEMAKILGISVETLYRWIDEYEEKGVRWLKGKNRKK